MIADLHRTLLEVGVFLCPGTLDRPDGKLGIGIMYECNLLTFIRGAAGGEAVNDRGRILYIVPKFLHETTLVYIGSKDLIEQLKINLQQWN